MKWLSEGKASCSRTVSALMLQCTGIYIKKSRSVAAEGTGEDQAHLNATEES